MILIEQSATITRLPDHILKSIEIAGRTCYKSEENITADSASKFVKMITERGHFSVLEHESIQVRFITDRGVTHELVRHRLAAFSQESTRYCDYHKEVQFIRPVWLDGLIRLGKHHSNLPFPKDVEAKTWLVAMLDAEASYKDLRNMGWSPQKARAVLPNSLKTEIVVTANLREWRHIFDLRCAPAAHPQMRDLMIPLREEFRKLLPEVYCEP